MKTRSVWLGASFFLFAVLACNLGKVKNSNESTGTTNKNTGSTSASNIHVKALHMAKDSNGEPGDETETFSPSDRTVHCVANLDDSKSGTKIEFAWWIVDAEGTKDEKLKEISYTTKALENTVHGHLTVPRDWPKGTYKCEVSINGKVDKSVQYTVE